MPFKETDVMNERIRFVALALEEEANITTLCRHFGISRTTGYRWIHRYRQEHSFTALGDRSRRPHRSPRKTPDAIEERVVALRQQYGWGARKLAVLLAQEGVRLSVSTVHRIISRHGLVGQRDAHRPAVKRFERKTPNELWQMDFKGYFPIQEGKCYPFSIVDDHSRYALGLYALSSPNAQATYDCLCEAFRRYGVPEAILMDHGSPWWATQGGGGLTWLAVQLMKQDIQLRFSGFRHPQTQGKVEAFHRTLSRDFAHHGRPHTLAEAVTCFDRFREDYNHRRPHEALDMAVPAARYRASDRAYATKPPAWTYDEDLTTTRLNSQGSLTYQRRRYFVAESLAGERVAYREVDGKLLVQYRQMYIREINLSTRQTRAFLRPVRDKILVRPLS